MSHLVLLDNEAAQALGDPRHPRHSQVVRYTQVVAERKRRAAAIRMAVPTTVRVEAGWDRTAPAWAFANRLRVTDIPLDSTQADVAARLRKRIGVSVADSHLGAVIHGAGSERVTVITSDPDDMRAVTGTTALTIVTI